MTDIFSTDMKAIYQHIPSFFLSSEVGHQNINPSDPAQDCHIRDPVLDRVKSFAQFTYEYLS